MSLEKGLQAVRNKYAGQETGRNYLLAWRMT